MSGWTSDGRSPTAEPRPFWLADPAAPEPAAGADRRGLVRPRRRRRRLHGPVDRAARQGARPVVRRRRASRPTSPAGPPPGATAGSARPASPTGSATASSRWPGEIDTLERLGRENLDDIEATVAPVRHRLRVRADRRAGRRHRGLAARRARRAGRGGGRRPGRPGTARRRRRTGRGRLAHLPRAESGTATASRWCTRPGWRGGCARRAWRRACACSSAPRSRSIDRDGRRLAAAAHAVRLGSSPPGSRWAPARSPRRCAGCGTSSSRLRLRAGHRAADRRPAGLGRLAAAGRASATPATSSTTTG